MNEDLQSPNLLEYIHNALFIVNIFCFIVVAFKCVIARRAHRNHNLFDF